MVLLPLLRQTFPKDFTFFIGPADKLLIDSTKNLDEAEYVNLGNCKWAGGFL
jgi:hypothetical protein